MRNVIFISEGGADSTSASGSGSPYSLVRALRGAGCHVVTCDSEIDGLQKYAVALRNWSPHRPTWRARFRLSSSAFAARSARAQAHVTKQIAMRPDSVVLQYGAGCQPMPSASTPLFLYCDNFSANTLGNHHSNIFQLPPSEQHEAMQLEARVYARAQRIFTMSEFIRSQFIAQLGIDEARLKTVHAGFSLDHATVTHESPRELQILFVGRDWVAKGGPRLLRSYRRLRARHPSLRLAVVGPRTLPDELLNEEGVTFHGFLDKSVPEEQAKLQSLYRTSRFFVLPTEYDSFGIAALEAMSYGLPVVLTGVGALTEIVTDGVTGYCTPPNADDELTVALAKLLDDPHAAMAMGERGKERALSYFTWNGVAERMLSGMDSR